MEQTPRSLKDWFAELLPLPESERERRLVDCAAGDPVLATELREMLAAVVGDDSFLAGLPDGTDALPPTRQPTAPTIGPYRRIRILGEGGMGTVWLAEQDAPVRRRVAIKQIKPGLACADLTRRFDRERQVLASLQHPGIAAVFDCGDGDDGPWFAMEFVEGTPLLRYCDQHRLPIEARLGLLLELCSAVQHAHDRQVVHRDLKPSNILVTTVDGRPFPKVIDFGLAALLAESADDDRLTRPDQWLGTPEYMAPEQQAGGGLVDARADVYALGVVAYELLCGALPFAARRTRSTPVTPVEPPRPSDRLGQIGADLVEVAATRGMRPSRLRSALRTELDWIVLMAIEHDPGRRYASVAEFADDLRRHLQQQPIRAHAPSTMQRLRKFVRRRRLLLTAATGVLVAGAAMALAASAARAEQTQRALAKLESGRVAAADGRWDEALGHFDQALAEQPADPIAIEVERVEALFAKGDTAAASAVLERIGKAAAGTPHAAKVMLLTGADLVGRDRDAGRRLLADALRLAEQNDVELPAADRKFADAMLATDLLAVAGVLQAALSSDPKHLRSMHVLGPVLLALGRADEALALAGRYQDRQPQAIEPRLVRAVALAALGRHAEASKACDLVTDTDAKIAASARLIVGALHAIDQVFELVAKHDVFGGLYQGLRSTPLSVVPLPPVELPANGAWRAELFMLRLGLQRSLTKLRPALNGDDAAIRALTEGWHPAILDSYSPPRAMATLTALAHEQLPDDRETLIPEAAVAVLWQARNIGDPRPDWTGWTAALPGVRRLAAWLDLGAILSRPMVAPWQPAEPALRTFNDAVDQLSTMRLTDHEFLGLAFLATNIRQPTNSDLADRVVARLERKTSPWLLFKAELNLARGARAEAQRLVDQVAADDQPAWVTSLRERLR